MTLESINLITTTLRIDPRYIESTPERQNWQDLGIEKVQLQRQVLQSAPNNWGATLTHNMTLVSPTQVGQLRYYELELNLAPDSTYRVRTVVTNSQGETTSDWQEFSTSDAEIYYNIETNIIDNVTGDFIEGATITIDPAGSEEQVSRPSGRTGLVWIQRIPAGTYPLLVEAPGYTSQTIVSLNVSSSDWQPGEPSTFGLDPV